MSLFLGSFSPVDKEKNIACLWVFSIINWIICQKDIIAPFQCCVLGLGALPSTSRDINIMQYLGRKYTQSTINNVLW